MNSFRYSPTKMNAAVVAPLQQTTMGLPTANQNYRERFLRTSHPLLTQTVFEGGWEDPLLLF